MSKKVNQPSNLSYQGSISPSLSVFEACVWDDKNTREKVMVDIHTVRTSNSHASCAEKDLGKTNIQRIEKAFLPPNMDTLVMPFSVIFTPLSGKPHSCNDPSVQPKMEAFIESYKSEGKLKELAFRYAYNIACGRPLWRNFTVSSQVSVKVAALKTGTSWVFDCDSFSRDSFESDNPQLVSLAEDIHEGLSGGTKNTCLEVTYYAQLGFGGATVFPSQEMELGKNKDKIGKILAKINGQAAMHSQKIGNAIRTIDTWYPDAGPPLAVSPYGSNTFHETAHRKKLNFYSLLKDLLNDKQPQDGQDHYVIAQLILGGVFGKKEK